MLWFRDVCIEKQDQERLRGRHGTYTGSSRTGRRWTREQSEGDTRPLEWENLRVPRSTPRIIMWFVTRDKEWVIQVGRTGSNSIQKQ